MYTVFEFRACKCKYTKLQTTFQYSVYALQLEKIAAVSLRFLFRNNAISLSRTIGTGGIRGYEMFVRSWGARARTCRERPRTFKLCTSCGPVLTKLQFYGTTRPGLKISSLLALRVQDTDTRILVFYRQLSIKRDKLAILFNTSRNLAEFQLSSSFANSPIHPFRFIKFHLFRMIEQHNRVKCKLKIIFPLRYLAETGGLNDWKKHSRDESSPSAIGRVSNFVDPARVPPIKLIDTGSALIPARYSN